MSIDDKLKTPGGYLWDAAQITDLGERPERNNTQYFEFPHVTGRMDDKQMKELLEKFKQQGPTGNEPKGTKFEEINNNPKKALEAGIIMTDEQYNNDAGKIIAILTQSPKECFHAGCHWSDERFDKAAGQIIDVMTRSAPVSYDAGRYWRDNRFELAAEQILTSIEGSPEQSYFAGELWNDERFDKYATRIINTVTKSPGFCYRSGLHWHDNRFNKAAEKFITVIKTDNVHMLLAACDWKTERAELLAAEIQQKWHTSVLQIQEAHSFATQAKKILEFYTGLLKNIENNTADKYCDAIIKYFRSSTIGGGNYCLREVGA